MQALVDSRLRGNESLWIILVNKLRVNTDISTLTFIFCMQKLAKFICT